MKSEEKLSLNVQIQEKEYIYFFLYSKYKIVSFMLLCLFIICMVYLFILTELTSTMTILLSAGITLLIILPLLLLLLIYFAKKIFKNDSALREEGSIEVSHQGFKLAEPSESVFVEWKYFYSIKELKDFFILYYSTSNAILIPKRIFNSKEDILIFKNFFLNNMNKNKIYFKNKT